MTTDRHKNPPISVRLPADLREWIEQFAAKHGRPVNRVIVTALSEARLRLDYRLDFVQEWQCEPPPLGTKFQVIRDEWTDGNDESGPLRTIHEIAIIEPGNDVSSASFGFRKADAPHVITETQIVSYGPVLDPPWPV